MGRGDPRRYSHLKDIGVGAPTYRGRRPDRYRDHLKLFGDAHRLRPPKRCEGGRPDRSLSADRQVGITLRSVGPPSLKLWLARQLTVGKC